MITNQEVSTRPKQHSIASTLGERRQRWLGHMLQMDHQCIPQQAPHWEVQGFKRGPGRPRTNRRGIVKKDLPKMGLMREEAEVTALDRSEWHQRVAQDVSVDMG